MDEIRFASHKALFFSFGIGGVISQLMVFHCGIRGKEKKEKR